MKKIKVEVNPKIAEKEVKQVKPKKLKVSIKLSEEENYCIVNRKSTVIVFSESVNDKTKTDVELILPNEEDVTAGEISNPINLATAITIRLKTDPKFGVELIEWFANYIQQLEITSTTN